MKADIKLFEEKDSGGKETKAFYKRVWSIILSFFLLSVVVLKEEAQKTKIELVALWVISAGLHIDGNSEYEFDWRGVEGGVLTVCKITLSVQVEALPHPTTPIIITHRYSSCPQALNTIPSNAPAPVAPAIEGSMGGCGGDEGFQFNPGLNRHYSLLWE